MNEAVTAAKLGMRTGILCCLGTDPAGEMIEQYLQKNGVSTVDSTGAGDNFIAGFASEILRGNSCREALRFANACGAVCTTALGGRTGLQNREQIRQFIELEERNNKE